MGTPLLREINLTDTSEIDELFPGFVEYAHQVRGFMNCPAKEEVRLWYEYLLFLTVKDWLSKSEVK